MHLRWKIRQIVKELRDETSAEAPDFHCKLTLDFQTDEELEDYEEEEESEAEENEEDILDGNVLMVE